MMTYIFYYLEVVGKTHVCTFGVFENPVLLSDDRGICKRETLEKMWHFC